MNIVNIFVFFPFWLRSAILLYIIIIFWSIFRKIILRALSVIPFLLKYAFRYVYLIFEFLISILHKKYGMNFYRIDNQVAQTGRKIYLAIGRWYIAWHKPKKYSLKKALVVYFVCVFYIVLPSLFTTNSKLLKMGEEVYSKCEEWLVLCLEQKETDNRLKSALWKNFEMKMVVSQTTDNGFLLVRGSPSEENRNVLIQLEDGDFVIWRGIIFFSDTEVDTVEPWVKISTIDGTEGWIKLCNIRSEEYIDKEFYMIY